MAARTVPLVKVRHSRIHGRGVFALRRIPKGTRIIEYLGDRITHAQADKRYDDHDERDNHTFLFSVDRGLVIDAGVDGNDARFINHSCGPNCESVIERRRVFIEAIRDIERGEELSYDYQIGRERDDPPDVDEIYACRCGSAECRGTMLWPPRRKPRPRKGKAVKAQAARGKAAKGKVPKGKAANGKTPKGKAAKGEAARGKSAKGKSAQGKAVKGKSLAGKSSKKRARREPGRRS